ncbi:Dolichyl-diphosphooligosaccharide--protein glycosyltransferase subunit 4A [Camellia lanceoleosa]|uniref:Dolichyl-diphosphooligosaccharide--protein glycosyltransferase subunit 4A n=1 Tax=Camellia lanceoleosa TaxID=1840588 RepID=A0ACC0H2F5_9ERIC|nr:Dolichyl-diphosphooligosaccharide--protein glycosyltransferase subunit 4A [Camellia lanceoleosa]
MMVLKVTKNVSVAFKGERLKMIDDQDLGFFANFLGIFIFVLVIAYHYVMADPKVSLSLSLSLSSHCKLSNTLSKTFLAVGHLGRLLNAGLEKPKVLLP